MNAAQVDVQPGWDRAAAGGRQWLAMAGWMASAVSAVHLSWVIGVPLLWALPASSRTAWGFPASIGAQAPDYRWDFERPWNGTANSPPSGSWYGQRRYEIGDTPTGAWAGHAGDIAVGDGNGTSVKWAFYTPPDGAIYWDYGIVEAKDLTIELASGQTMWVRVGGWGNSEKLVTGAGAEDEPPWGVGQGKMAGRSITALVTAA